MKARGWRLGWEPALARGLAIAFAELHLLAKRWVTAFALKEVDWGVMQEVDWVEEGKGAGICAVDGRGLQQMQLASIQELIQRRK